MQFASKLTDTKRISKLADTKRRSSSQTGRKAGHRQSPGDRQQNRRLQVASIRKQAGARQPSDKQPGDKQSG